MKPVKAIAGEILLYFYTLQRRRGFDSMEIIRFDGWDNINIPASSQLEKDLLTICKESAADLYNALSYLSEKYLLSFNKSRNSGGDMLHGFKVTAGGMDIIEGIERGPEERNNFYLTFNIKVADNINVDSLIKNEIGSLLKGSLFSA